MFWLDRYGCWEYKSHCCCVNTALEWSIIEYRAYLRSPKWTTESVSKDLKDSVTQQQVPEKERTRPSECVIAQETTHGSSSFNLGLQMKLMENRYIFCRDVGWWAEYLVAEAINELNCHLQYLAGKKTIIFIPIIKTCLLNYYTLQEMQTQMLGTVEQYFTSLFSDD